MNNKIILFILHPSFLLFSVLLHWSHWPSDFFLPQGAHPFLAIGRLHWVAKWTKGRNTGVGWRFSCWLKKRIQCPNRTKDTEPNLGSFFFLDFVGDEWEVWGWKRLGQWRMKRLVRGVRAWLDGSSCPFSLIFPHFSFSPSRNQPTDFALERMPCRWTLSPNFFTCPFRIPFIPLGNNFSLFMFEKKDRKTTTQNRKKESQNGIVPKRTWGAFWVPCFGHTSFGFRTSSGCERWCRHTGRSSPPLLRFRFSSFFPFSFSRPELYRTSTPKWSFSLFCWVYSLLLRSPSANQLMIWSLRKIMEFLSQQRQILECSLFLKRSFIWPQKCVAFIEMMSRLPQAMWPSEIRKLWSSISLTMFPSCVLGTKGDVEWLSVEKWILLVQHQWRPSNNRSAVMEPVY